MPTHLVEIEDIFLVPSWFRDLGTDWVRFTSDRLGLYRSVANQLATLLKASGSRRVLDVCSGSGGGWLSLAPQLDVLGVDNLRITLSDKYPNLRAAAYLAQNSDGRLQYCEQPLDVVREAGDGVDAYTMMLAFHHFPEKVAVQVLNGLMRKGRPIAIFDIWGPGLLRRVARPAGYLLLPIALVLNLFVPLLVLAGTPAVRPFRWSRLLFTYLLPVIPLYIWWDATVSILRAYDQHELRQIVGQADPDENFEWQVGLTHGRSPRSLSYLIGTPKRYSFQADQPR